MVARINDQTTQVRSRRGLTLIEVMASLLILGSAITGIVVAHGRSLRQIRSAGLQIRASEVARELIANWRIEGVVPSSAASGSVIRDGRWAWTRRSVPRYLHETISALEVVLTLEYHPQGDTDQVFRHEYCWLIPDSKD